MEEIMNFIKNKIIKLIPILGIFSVILYFLHVILGEVFYKGYNPLAQAVSDLTASNSPSKNIARLFSALYGVCSVSFSVGFFAYLRNKINRLITVSSFVFCIMNTITLNIERRARILKYQLYTWIYYQMNIMKNRKNIAIPGILQCPNIPRKMRFYYKQGVLIRSPL